MVREVAWTQSLCAPLGQRYPLGNPLPSEEFDKLTDAGSH